MKVYLDHSNITQNMHGANRNYRYVLDVSAGSVDCFSPPYERRVVFSKHRSSHLDEGSVLPFNDSILLRSVWSRELMSDAHLIEEFLYARVLEFGAVVPSNVLDL